MLLAFPIALPANWEIDKIMYIHKEGHKILVFIGLALFALNLLGYFLHFPIWLQILLGLASLVFYLLVLQFFRNPKRNIPRDEKHILAPADGKIVVIEETVENEYFQAPRIQISIFMSPLNVHINRSPIAGETTYYQYHAGKYLVAWHPKSSTENERNSLVIRHKQGWEILVRQIAGAVARRIRCYLDKGDTTQQGQEFGFIKFGSRVDVFLPLDAQVKVKIGDQSKGGLTVLASI